MTIHFNAKWQSKGKTPIHCRDNLNIISSSIYAYETVVESNRNINLSNQRVTLLVLDTYFYLRSSTNKNQIISFYQS